MLAGGGRLHTYIHTCRAISSEPKCTALIIYMWKETESGGRQAARGDGATIWCRMTKCRKTKCQETKCWETKCRKKMSKDKMSKDKMSNDKMLRDKMSRDKMP
jgi:hypothetical protein